MKRILIIDDDQDFLKEMGETLKLSGYEPLTLSNSELAFIKVMELKPDLILLDLKMEGMSGFQIANELSLLPETKHIPVIVITGVYTEQMYRTIMSLCCIKQCLTKPVSPLELISAIEKTM